MRCLSHFFHDWGLWEHYPYAPPTPTQDLQEVRTDEAEVR